LWHYATSLFPRELHDTLLQTFLNASVQLSVALDGIPWFIGRRIRQLTCNFRIADNSRKDAKSGLAALL